MWKEICKNYKRLVAFLLAVIMVITNAGGNVGTAFAAEERECALFMLEGQAIIEAVQALDAQEEITLEDLEWDNSNKGIGKAYEKLFYPKNGKVCALGIEADDQFAPEGTGLRIFFSVEEKEVIFLFINEREEAVDFCVNIDGYETSLITLGPGRSEVSEGTGENNISNRENLDNVSGLGNGDSAVDEDGLTEDKEEISENISETEKKEDVTLEDEIVEDETLDEKKEIEETKYTEDNQTSSSQELSGSETEDRVLEEEVKTESLDKKEEEAEDNSDKKEEGETEDNSGEVGLKEDNLDKEEVKKDNSDKEEAEKDNSGREEEKENDSGKEDAKDTLSNKQNISEEKKEVTEAPASEREDLNKVPSDKNIGSESSDSNKGSESSDSNKDSESSDDKASDVTDLSKSFHYTGLVTISIDGIQDDGVALEKDNIDAAKDEEEKNVNETETGETHEAEEVTEIEEDTIKTEYSFVGDKEFGDDWEIPGKVYNTITLQNTAKARAYCVKMEEIEKIVKFNESFIVNYRINPANAAKVTGADTIEMGEDLYFAVETEKGYRIAEVYANGEKIDFIEDISVLDEETLFTWKGYSHIYTISKVEEDLEIEVNLEEIEPAISSAVYIAEMDDSIFTVDVPNGAFAEEVELQVKKIENKEHLEELSAKANKAVKSDKAVIDVLAYDISFVSIRTGEEIEPAKAVGVNIRFKDKVETEESKDKEVTGLSIIHLTEDEKAEVVTSTEDAKEKEFTFQTEGFSIYVVTLESSVATEYNGEKYETLQAAIDAVAEGNDNEAVIKLTANIFENVSSTNTNYTLEMGGYVLAGKEKGSNVMTIDGGLVTIQNGTITAGTAQSNSGGRAISATGKTELNLVNCKIEKNTGGGISIEGLGEDTDKIAKLNVNQCEIVENGKTSGNSMIKGGIEAIYCEVILKDSVLSGNQTASTPCGGVGVKAGKLTIINTSITGNRSKADMTAGGLSVINTDVYIEKTNIVDNSVYIRNESQLVKLNSVTVENITGNFGFFVSGGGEFSAVECIFRNNVINAASQKNKITSFIYNDSEPINGQQGVLEFTGSGSRTLQYCDFINNSGNEANYSHAPLYFYQNTGEIKIEHCHFTGNQGWNYGALDTTGEGKISIEESLFSDNTGKRAGAMKLGDRGSGNEARLINTVIKNNQYIEAPRGFDNAGGLVICGQESLEMIGGALYGNKAYNDDPSDVNIASEKYKTVTIPATIEMNDDGTTLHNWVWTNGQKELDASESLINNTYNEKGIWYAIKKPAKVAQIGSTVYETLEAAINEARNGDTIQLLKQNTQETEVENIITVDNMLVIDKDITIAMNDCEIHGIGDDAAGALFITLRDGKAVSGGIFKIVEGGSLTLKETGLIDNSIILAGGSLNINGNISVQAKGNKFPITGIDRNSSALDGNKEPYGGIINVNADVDSMEVCLLEGEFHLNSSGAIQNLYLKLGRDDFKPNRNPITDLSANIDGDVGTLIIEQAGALTKDVNTKLILNSTVDSLELTHAFYQSENPFPITEAGPNFCVKDSVTLIPSEREYNKSNQANPLVSTKDICMIYGNLQKEQINLEKADWKVAKDNDKLIWDKSMDSNADGKNYKFLTFVALSEEGIVLRKTLSRDDGIYLDGVNGSDEEDNPGISPESAVKSFARAKDLLENHPEFTTIYLIGTVTIDGTENWSLGRDKILQRYPTFDGQMIKIPLGSELTLHNIIIDGNGEKIQTIHTPIIDNEGTLMIEEKDDEKTVLQNNWNSMSGQDISRNVLSEGGGVRSSGKLVMKGGTIQKNKAVSGGGVFVKAGTFTMEGGQIEYNQAEGTFPFQMEGEGSALKNEAGRSNAGGGVFLASDAVMNFSGGKIAYNQADMGGGISLGNKTNYYLGGTLNMTGGSVEDNISGSEGGGIYIQEKGSAKISAGFITHNESKGGSFGGGGIYVNGGKEYGNGKLELENVKISENTAKGSHGGGIAACPTANVKVYLQNGGQIFNNYLQEKENSRKKDDIFIRRSNASVIDISRYMLGGGLSLWRFTKDDDIVPARILKGGTSEISIYSSAAADKISDDKVKVFITGNQAETRGGGIGSNGDVIVGTETDKPPITVTVKKQWNVPEAEKEAFKEMLAFTSIGFTLWARHKGEDDSAWIKVDEKEINFQIEEKIVEFTELMAKDIDGREWEYKVTENESDRYYGQIQKEEEENTWVAVNEAAYSLKISKTVVDMYKGEYPENQRFDFILQLRDRDGNPYGKESSTDGKVMALNQDGNAIEIFFNEEGKAKIDLANGESVWIKGLSAGMTYFVEELPCDDYTPHIQITTNKPGSSSTESLDISGGTTGEQVLAFGCNAVCFINETNEPHGSLKIRKQVLGKDGDREKQWHFQVKLTKEGTEYPIKPETGKTFKFSYQKYQEDDGRILLIEDGKVEMNEDKTDGSINFIHEDEVWESIALADHQYVLINGLPLGTECKVMEEEADIEHYETTWEIKTDAGILDANRPLEVIQHHGHRVNMECTNRFKTGVLEIEKTVIGTPADSKKAFAFTLETANPKLEGVYGDVTFHDGVAEFTLTDGEKKQINDLPEGMTYEVREADYEGYTSSASGNTEGIIQDQCVIIVKFVNTANSKAPEDPKDPEKPDDSREPDNPNEPDSPQDPDNSNEPDDPKEPDNPVTPNRPSSSGNSSGRNPHRDISLTEGGTPAPNVPEVPKPLDIIEEEDVPLADLPVPDLPSVPLQVLIPEEDIPLVGLPRTSDGRHMGLWAALFGTSALGILLSLAWMKRNKEEKE